MTANDNTKTTDGKEREKKEGNGRDGRTRKKTSARRNERVRVSERIRTLCAESHWTVFPCENYFKVVYCSEAREMAAAGARRPSLAPRVIPVSTEYNGVLMDRLAIILTFEFGRSKPIGTRCFSREHTHRSTYTHNIYIYIYTVAIHRHMLEEEHNTHTYIWGYYDQWST